jgi:hypothetical protein
MKKISLLTGIIIFSLSISVSAKSENLDANTSFTQTDMINFDALDTTVSNEKPEHSLVQASIINGKYKGAKLSGELINIQEPAKSTLKRYALTFSKISLNSGAQPIKISAYAIDPDTAHTALSSKVGDKYLIKNGRTLAVSFIQSYSTSLHPKVKDHSVNTIEPTKVKINSGTNIAVLFMPNYS